MFSNGEITAITDRKVMKEGFFFSDRNMSLVAVTPRICVSIMQHYTQLYVRLKGYKGRVIVNYGKSSDLNVY